MHDGHRNRLRQRIINEGTDSFEEHQLLEALLFYSIPRADTNETAHRLIERFGSLAGVISASRDELTHVEGIGESSALLIRLVGGILRKIAVTDNTVRYSFDSIGKICKYLANLYTGVTVERVYLMMFDNSMKLIDCAHICDGTVNSAIMLPRVMVEKALLRRASVVVVAHNHPDGIAVPSGDDIETTEMLRSAFELLGINLLEHIVVAGRSYSPILRQRNLAKSNNASYIVCSGIPIERFYGASDDKNHG